MFCSLQMFPLHDGWKHRGRHEESKSTSLVVSYLVLCPVLGVRRSIGRPLYSPELWVWSYSKYYDSIQMPHRFLCSNGQNCLLYFTVSFKTFIYQNCPENCRVLIVSFHDQNVPSGCFRYYWNILGGLRKALGIKITNLCAEKICKVIISSFQTGRESRLFSFN